MWANFQRQYAAAHGCVSGVTIVGRLYRSWRDDIVAVCVRGLHHGRLYHVALSRGCVTDGRRCHGAVSWAAVSRGFVTGLRYGRTAVSRGCVAGASQGDALRGCVTAGRLCGGRLYRRELHQGTASVHGRPELSRVWRLEDTSLGGDRDTSPVRPYDSVRR